MRPTKRYGTNKRKSARKFRRNIGRTKQLNINAIQRGGIRL